MSALKNPSSELRFITDFGQSMPMTDGQGKSLGTIPRYGVWGDLGRGKPEVIECHDDLERMKQEHGVPDERVVPISTAPAEENPYLLSGDELSRAEAARKAGR